MVVLNIAWTFWTLKEPVKRKNKSVENSTLGKGGSGPGHLPHFQQKNELCFKCIPSNLKPFLTMFFFNFFGCVPPKKF